MEIISGKIISGLDCFENALLIAADIIDAKSAESIVLGFNNSLGFKILSFDPEHKDIQKFNFQTRDIQTTIKKMMKYSGIDLIPYKYNDLIANIKQDDDSIYFMDVQLYYVPWCPYYQKKFWTHACVLDCKKRLIHDYIFHPKGAIPLSDIDITTLEVSNIYKINKKITNDFNYVEIYLDTRDCLLNNNYLKDLEIFVEGFIKHFTLDKLHQLEDPLHSNLVYTFYDLLATRKAFRSYLIYINRYYQLKNYTEIITVLNQLIKDYEKIRNLFMLLSASKKKRYNHKAASILLQTNLKKEIVLYDLILSN